MSGENDHRVRGGLARAEALTPDERREIARAAALARWAGDVPRATHTGELIIGGMVLPCSVLEDDTRVLSESGFATALGRARSGSPWLPGADPGARMPHYALPKSLSGYMSDELVEQMRQPIKFRPANGGKVAYGVDAKLIPAICEAWLSARDAKALSPQQLRTAEKAEILIRGLARVGIIALVDEATGFQEVRDRLALQRILDAYMARELAAWAKRFPTEFYQQMFRLRNWEWDNLKNGKGQGPRVIGKYTNDYVYSRLAPGLLQELQRRNPPDSRGKRKAKHHQWLSDDVGHPALAQHIHAVIGLMRAAETWEQFEALINRAFPPRTSLKDLPLFNQPGVALED